MIIDQFFSVDHILVWNQPLKPSKFKNISFRIAFTALYASEEKNIGLKSHGNFLSVLRESMLWMVDGNEHDEMISKVANGLTSNMSDAWKWKIKNFIRQKNKTI